MDGNADVLPGSDDDVTFPAAAGPRQIDLAGTRAIGSLSVLGDYGLSGGTLEVTSGLVGVSTNATATLASDVLVPTGLLKTGDGTLVVNATVESVTQVLAGTLSGTGTLHHLLVSAAAVVAPGQSVGELTVTGNTSLLGTLRVELGATASDRISVVGNLALGSTAVLELAALERLAVGDEGFGRDIAHHPDGGPDERLVLGRAVARPAHRPGCVRGSFPGDQLGRGLSKQRRGFGSVPGRRG